MSSVAGGRPRRGPGPSFEPFLRPESVRERRFTPASSQPARGVFAPGSELGVERGEVRGEAGLDLTGQVVDEDLRGVGFDAVER